MNYNGKSVKWALAATLLVGPLTLTYFALHLTKMTALPTTCLHNLVIDQVSYSWFSVPQSIEDIFTTFQTYRNEVKIHALPLDVFNAHDGTGTIYDMYQLGSAGQPLNEYSILLFCKRQASAENVIFVSHHISRNDYPKITAQFPWHCDKLIDYQFIQ